MIPRKPDPRPTLYFLSTPSPETSPRSSTVVSDCEADDEETMSMDDVVPTRDPREAIDSTDGLYTPQRPSLPAVLSNSAPPPWTLSAFTAYLSNNHCLENLEFTMDAARYRERHDEMTMQLAGIPNTPEVEDVRYVRMLWQRLLDAYLVPDGPREINIPSDVRDRLLSLPNHSMPPSPDALDAAVKIVYKLMEESVLISFLNEAPPPTNTQARARPIPSHAANVGHRKRGGSDSSNEKKSYRSRSRRRESPTASLDVQFSAADPTGRLTAGGITSRTSHTSNASGDPGLSTDDSNSVTSPIGEPMTPPHTPPSSEFGGASPKQRNDLGWKKMLGWKKKSGSGIRDQRASSFDD